MKNLQIKNILILSLFFLYFSTPTKIDASEFGTLKIMTNPESATIYINGKKYGESPLFVEGLSFNECSLYIEKNGYKPIKEKVFIKKDTVNIKSVELSMFPWKERFNRMNLGFNVSTTRGAVPLRDIIPRIVNFHGMNYKFGAVVDMETVVHVVLSADQSLDNALTAVLGQIGYDYRYEESGNSIIILSVPAGEKSVLVKDVNLDNKTTVYQGQSAEGIIPINAKLKYDSGVFWLKKDGRKAYQLFSEALGIYPYYDEAKQKLTLAEKVIEEEEREHKKTQIEEQERLAREKELRAAEAKERYQLKLARKVQEERERRREARRKKRLEGTMQSCKLICKTESFGEGYFRYDRYCYQRCVSDKITDN